MLLLFLSTIAFLLSLVALVHPISQLGLSTRKRAFISSMGSLFLIVYISENLVPERARAKSERAPASLTGPPKPSPAPSEPTVSKITFNEVYNKFGAESSLTELQKDEGWKEYRGKCVEWNGRLAYLDQGFFGGISVGFKHLSHTLTYDVLVSAPEEEKANLMTWNQGSKYTYRATLKNYGVILPIGADWGCGE